MKPRFSLEFWLTLAAILISLTPALLWSGKTDARLENLEKQREILRLEIREDLREINRKLDKLTEKIK